jgi:hypothetical protein
MTTEGSLLTVDDREDDDGTISYPEWILTLTSPARAALGATQRRQPSCSDASLPANDRDGVAALSKIVGLIVEVRDLLISQRLTRDYYGTDQTAHILGKAQWTVREWCRLGRVNAEKRYSGRGRSCDWVISHAELLRIQKEGLLPAKH